MTTLLLLGIGTATAGPAEAWLDALVLVQQGSTVCAGTLVDPSGTVVTAYHCVSSGGRPKVTTRAGQQGVGRVVNHHVGSDLARIDVPELAGSPWLSLRPTSPEIGEAVFALGHPLGVDAPDGYFEDTLRWSISSGLVSNIGKQSIQVTTPLNPGNSGGPIVDADGRIAGVVSRRLAGAGLGFATRIELVRALLEEPMRPQGAGGTIAMELLTSSFEGTDGILSGGVRIESALRDRVLVTATLAVAPAARWDSVRFGRVRWVSADARAGFRQRIGRGPWAVRLDGVGGVAWLQTLKGGPDLVLERGSAAVPLLGVAVGTRNFGLDGAWFPSEHAWRGSLVLRWPGVFGVW